MACHNPRSWQRDVQREENATSIRHLLNHNSCRLCARRFLSPNEKNVSHTWMEETKCKPKGLYQNAHMSVFSAAGRSSLSVFFFFFFFFTRKKGAYVFDILVEGEKERERESLSFFFLTIPVCHHSGRQWQKEAADRSVTFRNQLIAQQRNDFRPRQLRCSFAARLSASRSGEVHSDKELIQDTTASKRRTVQDEGHTTPVTSSRSSTSSTCTCTYA